MELVSVLGVDPSLRNTGMAIINYNTDKDINDPQAFSVMHAHVLVNPPKYKGTEAILNMIDMINDCSLLLEYTEPDTVIVESPPVMFNKLWSAGTVSSIAHISGAAVALLGLHKGHLFRPNEWNKSRKKEVTHAKTIELLGHPDTWHFHKRIKSDKLLEHVLDAASMALWWIKENYLED